MLYVIKESDRNVVIFHRSDDTIEKVLDWLADCNPRSMTHLLTVNDTDDKLYMELKTNYEIFNIRNDWYRVEKTHGWEWLFEQMAKRSAYRNWEAINPLFYPYP